MPESKRENIAVTRVWGWGGGEGVRPVEGR